MGASIPNDGVDITYDGTWGYHPLVVSLANAAEPLFLINHSGNRPPHEMAASFLDRRSAPRLALLLFGAVLARRRQVGRTQRLIKRAADLPVVFKLLPSFVTLKPPSISSSGR